MSLALFGADPSNLNPDSVSWWDAFFSSKPLTPAPDVYKGLAPTTAFVTGPQGTYVPAGADVQQATAQMAAAMDNADQALLGINTAIPANFAFQQSAHQQLQDIYSQYLAASGRASVSQYRAWLNQVNTITTQALALPKVSNPPTVTGATNVPTNVPSRLDPTQPGPNKTQVQLSTADQIKQISDSIFGAVSSGAKQFFEIKAMQLAARGQPVNVPNTPATQSEIMGTGTKVALGVGGLLVIGAVIFALARRN